MGSVYFNLLVVSKKSSQTMTNTEQLLVNTRISTRRVWYKSDIRFWLSYNFLPIPKNNTAEANANSKAFCPAGWDSAYWGDLAYR